MEHHAVASTALTRIDHGHGKPIFCCGGALNEYDFVDICSESLPEID